MITLNQSINTRQGSDTDSSIIHLKTKDAYEDIANYVKQIFETSNYEINRPLPIGKNRKVIILMKEKLGGKIVTEFVGFRPRTYNYLIDNGNSDKKAKGKKCPIKQRLQFNDYKNCKLNNETILKSQKRFEIEAHNV